MSNLTFAEPRNLVRGQHTLPPTLLPLFYEEPVDTAAWELLLPPHQLPVEDNETLETNQHRIAMDALIRGLKHIWSDRQDYFTGGNMFIYFSAAQVRNKSYRGPDFFVALDVDGSYSREAWILWEEKWKYPDVIIELLSPSTQAEDLGPKKNLYERLFKTTDYFVFEPLKANSLRGWHLTAAGVYEELVANAQGQLWSSKLGMWLGVWEGIIEKDYGAWLRFYDSAGQLMPLPEEAAKQAANLAKQEAEAAKQEANLAKQEAEAVKQEAALAKQEAEAVKQEAALAKQEAEAAKQEAHTALQRAAKLAEQLRALGIDANQIT